MQPTITIESIGNKYLLEDEKYEYLLAHLNEPLPRLQKIKLKENS